MAPFGTLSAIRESVLAKARDSDGVYIPRWLTYDEVMNRAATTTRGTYIKLQSLLLEETFELVPEPEVRFGSPVYNSCGMPPGMPLHPVNSRVKARVAKLSDSAIELMIQHPDTDKHSDMRLVIPLEFVRAVWIEQQRSSQPHYLFVSLDMTLEWNCER